MTTYCDNLYYLDFINNQNKQIEIPTGFASPKEAREFAQSFKNTIKLARIFKKQKFVVDEFTDKDM